MGRSVNSSLFAGLAVGTGLVLVGVIGASIVYPPVPSEPANAVTQTQPIPEAEPVTPLAEIEAQSAEPSEMPDTPALQDILEDDSATDPVPDADPTPEAEPAPDEIVSEEMALEEPEMEEPASDAAATPAPETTSVPQEDAAQDEDEDELPAPSPADETSEAPQQASPQVLAEAPSLVNTMRDDGAPDLPAPLDNAGFSRLPSQTAEAPRADATFEGVQFLPPAPVRPIEDAPEVSTGPQADDTPEDRIAQEPVQTLPGTRVSGLPRIGEGSDTPVMVDQDPLPDEVTRPALLRNSHYVAGTDTTDKMALVLSDPGLPMPVRRELAALDYPFTIALNPMDSTAAEAAEIYFDAGKEVLILASGLPGGATASDLDVSLNAYFTALPLAVGMIDLPEDGFARNAGLLREVLPLLASDGHGLLTFAGGLTQAGRAAEAAGVSHSEVFRVLDSGNESIFTIRRYLDRAVFQASQIGHVIVFGDAANEETLDAIEMWRSERRGGQVALVPVSGILLQND